MGLKLLHLSDIHFKDFKDKAYLDLDKDIQNEIELDLQYLKTKVGSIDTILIGGDIAFSGRDIEYEEADKWIKRISEITGCPKENILTVPGNHDVDRSKICPILNEAQTAFKDLRERQVIDEKLAKYLSVESSSLILLRPFENYNSFAQNMDRSQIKVIFSIGKKTSRLTQ